MWDERYSQPGFAYGTEPNEFLAAAAGRIPVGPVLSLGEGEGRVAELGGGEDEVFGVAGGLEEGEGAVRAELDVVLGLGHARFSSCFRLFSTFDLPHSLPDPGRARWGAIPA